MLKIDEINQEPAILEVIKSFAAKPLGTLLLSGKNGTGKSFAAEAIYESRSRYKLPEYNHDESWFINQADLNMLWQQRMFKFNEVHTLLQELTSSRLLVLDDIGTRTPSESFMDFLYSIADGRYRGKDRLGTIITTNLNSVKMREMFGDAFTSRIASGRCLRFDGPDRRIQEF